MPRRIRLVLLMTLLCSACAIAPDIPPWFDSIHRRPIKTVLVQGHRIAYLDEGQGPPVILIHGFGGSMWHWEYQQPALSVARRVITPDLLGSGLSDKPDLAYTPADFVELIKDFMDALKIGRATLVGNSMGAGVTIGMALTYPDKVDRLVLIDGLPDHVRENLASPMMKHAIDSWLPVWLLELGNRITGRETTRAFLSEFIHDPRLLTPAVIERSYRNRQRPGIIAPLMAMARSLPLWEEGFAKRFGEIKHPTLILWGAEDKVFPLQVGKDLQTAIDGSKIVVIPEAGHIPQWERPDVVNPLIIQFLQS